MPLTPEVESTLHDRYYDWIVKTKKHGREEQPAGRSGTQEGESIPAAASGISAQLATNEGYSLMMDTSAE